MLVYDPQTGQVDWNKSDLSFPEYALRWLLRRRYSEAEITLIREEAKAYVSIERTSVGRTRRLRVRGEWRRREDSAPRPIAACGGRRNWL